MPGEAVMGAFIRDLATCPLAVDEFDERLWAVAVDSATVRKDGKLVFRLKDGTEILGVRFIRQKGHVPGDDTGRRCGGHTGTVVAPGNR